MKNIIIIFVLMCITFSINAEVLKDTEIELMEMLLKQNDMSLQSLNFLKDWARDTKIQTSYCSRIFSIIRSNSQNLWIRLKRCAKNMILLK